MNIQEATKQLNELLEAWDLDEASLNQTDIDAIKVVIKELSLKDREYEVLRITSESIEEDQRREIYELQQITNKARNLVAEYIEKKRDGITFEELYKFYKILNNEEVE